MYHSKFKISCWEQILIFPFFFFFMESCGNIISYSTICFQNVFYFHMCLTKRVKYSSLFALQKSVEIISFPTFCQIISSGIQRRTEDLVYFSKRKAEHELFHA